MHFAALLIARAGSSGDAVTRKFIFIKDVENFLKQGKTELQVPEYSRFSPAAWDMVREKNIQLSFKAQSSQPDVEINAPKRQTQTSREQPVPSKPGLVAVASAKREPSGTIGQFAGRSPYFLIFDFKGRFIDIVKNPYSAESAGIGRSVADLLDASQVSVFVAEQFGQNIKRALSDKNIQYFEISGPIEEAIKSVFNEKGGDKRVPNK
jgi:predicted Fe-Mo cluster-binding NifX family protein